MSSDPLCTLRRSATLGPAEPADLVTQAASFLRQLPQAERTSEVTLLVESGRTSLSGVVREMGRLGFWQCAMILALCDDLAAREVVSGDSGLSREVAALRQRASNAAAAWAGDLARDPGLASLQSLMERLSTAAAPEEPHRASWRWRPKRSG